jgi:hypothetical protein
MTMTMSFDVVAPEPLSRSPWVIVASAALLGIVLSVFRLRRGRRAPRE